MDQDSFPISFKIHTSQQKINIFTHDSKLTTFFIKSELYSRIIQETSNSFKDSTIIIHDLFKSQVSFKVHAYATSKGKFQKKKKKRFIAISIKSIKLQFHYIIQIKFINTVTKEI